MPDVIFFTKVVMSTCKIEQSSEYIFSLFDRCEQSLSLSTDYKVNFISAHQLDRNLRLPLIPSHLLKLFGLFDRWTVGSTRLSASLTSSILA